MSSRRAAGAFAALLGSLAVLACACGSDARPAFTPDDAGPGDAGTVGFVDASLGPCQPDPAAFDIPGNGCDDDGDGVVDNVDTSCDDNLS